MLRSPHCAGSLVTSLLAVLVCSCSGTPVEPPEESVARELAQATATSVPTTPVPPNPPTLNLERISRDHYLKDRLTALRYQYKAPAVAAALVMDGATSTAAVAGLRKWGVAGNALLGDAFMVKSCSKSMTGYLAARFIANQTPLAIGSNQTFSWTTKILDVFPELAPTTNAAYVNTTVEVLMTHRSGMPSHPDGEPMDEYASITSSLTGRRYEYVKDAVVDPPLDPSPYGGGSIIVAAMLERITGQSWEALMDTWVYSDLGMTNAGVGSNPYPANPNQVTSHTRDSAGTPVPWTPPTDYATEPHAPAGRNTHASILDFAKYAAAHMATASSRPGSLGDAALANALFIPQGSTYARSGWATDTTPADEGSVPRYFNRGSDGADRSLVRVIPSLNYATVVMTNADDPDAVMSYAAHDEIVGMKRHLATAGAYDDVLNVGQYATATSTYSAGYGAEKANDGSLLTRWAAVAGVTTATLEVGLDGLTTISKIRIAERYDRIQSFVLEARIPTPWGVTIWTQVAQGTTVGANYLATFSPRGALAVRIRVLAASNGPSISEMWVL